MVMFMERFTDMLPNWDEEEVGKGDAGVRGGGRETPPHESMQ